jgi:hypothetical protein
MPATITAFAGFLDNTSGIYPPWTNAVLRGPTPVDLSVIDWLKQGKRKSGSAIEHPNEKAMLRSWRRQDLAQFYREQRSNRRRT